jgi:phage protein Gp37/Gp68
MWCDERALDWIIFGGESADKSADAPPCNLAWARSTIAQGRDAGVAVYVKQLGAWPFLHAASSHESSGPGFRLRVASLEVETSIELRDRRGGDPAEWAEDLRVREFPPR